MGQGAGRLEGAGKPASCRSVPPTQQRSLRHLSSCSLSVTVQEQTCATCPPTCAEAVGAIQRQLPLVNSVQVPQAGCHGLQQTRWAMACCSVARRYAGRWGAAAATRCRLTRAESTTTSAPAPPQTCRTSFFAPGWSRGLPWAMSNMLKGPPSLAGVRCRSAGGGRAEQGGGASETCLDCMSPQPTRQCKPDVAYSSHTRQQHSRHSRSLSTPSKAVTRGRVSTRDCCMRLPVRRRCSRGCTVGCGCDGCCGSAGCQKLLSSALNTCSRQQVRMPARMVRWCTTVAQQQP